MASNSYEFEKKYAEYKNKKKKKQEREEEEDKKAQTQESTSLDAFDVKYEAYKSGKDPGLEWQRRRAENYVKNQSEKDPSKSESAQLSLSGGETQRGSRVGDTAVQVVPGKTVSEANKQVNATVRSASDIAKDLRAVDSQIENLNVNTTRNTSWVPANVQTEEQKQKLNSLKTMRERLQQEYNAATRLPDASEVSVPQNYTRNMPVTMPEGMRRAEYWASIPDYTDLTANLSELESKKQELTDFLDRSTRDLRVEKQKLLSQKGSSAEKRSRIDEIDAKLKEAEEKAGISAINQQIAELESILPASYAKLQRSADFEQNGVFDEGFANFSKDALYNLVNKPNEDNPLVTNFFDPQEGVKASEGIKAFSDIVTGTVFNDPTFIRNMTDNERKTYNYIYKKSGKEAAEKYLTTIESGLTARYREQIEEQSKKFAKEHPVTASALTVASSPLKAVGYVGQVADYAASGKIDQNSPRNAAAYSSTAVRGEVAENIDESITRKVGEVWGNVGSNAYQIGMSMADFAFNTLASGGTAPLASFIMGSSAAADTTIRAKDRGLKDNQAFALGFISGATELLTEKYSIDTLLEKSGMGKKAFTYWLKNVIGEGSEETTSEFVNIVADIMIAGDKSEWNQSIETYKKNGMSEQDAFWATFADNAINLGVSFIGGAVSGGTLAALKLGGDVIDRKVTHSSGQVHREIYDADTANKTEKLSAVNAALETAKSARIDDPAEMTKTSAEFVRTVRDARPDTKNAINTAIDYVREEISVYNDLIKDTKDSKQKSEYIVERAALINVDKTLRSNRAEVDAILANLPAQAEVQAEPGVQAQTETASAPEPTKPRQTVTKSVLKGYGIDTEVSANEFHEYLLNQLQTGKITQEEADALDAEYEAKYPKKAAETKLNAATAAYQKGEISEEQYDKQYSQYESELNDIDSRMSSETFPVRLRPVYEEVVQPVSEAETQTERTADNDANAADTTSVNAGEGSAPVRENAADIAGDEAQTAEETAERLAEEGYTFRQIRDQINAYRAENTAESNAAANRLEESERILVTKNRANVQKVANAYAPALKRFGINGVVVEDMPVGQNAAFDRKTNTIHLSSRISDSGAVGRFIVHEFAHRGAKIDMSLADSIVSAMESRKGGRGYVSEAVIRDAYADQLSGLTAEEADSIVREERAAHFMERIMEDVDVLDEFRDDRTFLRKILDAIRDFFARNNPDKQEQIRLRNIEKKINDLLKAANVDAEVKTGGRSETNVGDGDIRMSRDLDTSDSIQKDYEAAVDAVLNGTYNSDDVLIVGRTPDILQKIGLSALPVTITPNHVYSIAKTEAEAKAEGRYDKGTNYHGLGADAVKNILQNISDPVMIVSASDSVNGSKTKPRNSTHRLIAVTEFEVNGKRVIAPIEVDAEVKANDTFYDSNHVVSYYDKANINNILREVVAQENVGNTAIYYGNKKRIADFVKGPGFQLPDIFKDISDSDIIIRGIGENVNRKIEDVTQSQQFKRWFGDWQNDPENASKIVNEDGTPKVMYHGSPNQFTVFDKKRSKPSNLYGRGFYFSDSDAHAGTYGELYRVYLNVRNPLTPGGANVTEDQIRSFLEAVAENEDDYSIENYGTYDVDEILDGITSRDAFAVIQDVNATAIGNFLEAIELFNEVNGTDYDGIVTNTETVVFRPNQIKSATDNIGTFDPGTPDIRYSRDIDPALEREIRLRELDDQLEKQLLSLASPGWKKEMSSAQRDKFAKILSAELPGVSAREVSDAIKPVFELFAKPSRGSKDTAEVRADEIKKLAEKAAETLVDSAVQTELDPRYAEFKELVTAIRSTKGDSVTDSYKSLSEKFPEYFEPYTSELSEDVMSSRIKAVRSEASGLMRAKWTSDPFEGVRNDAVRSFSNRILTGFVDASRYTEKSAQDIKIGALSSEIRSTQKRLKDSEREVARQERQIGKQEAQIAKRDAVIADDKIIKQQMKDTLDLFASDMKHLNREVKNLNRRIIRLENTISSRSLNTSLASEQKRATAMARKIYNQVTRPSRKNHVPESIKEYIVNALRQFDGMKISPSRTIDATPLDGVLTQIKANEYQTLNLYEDKNAGKEQKNNVTLNNEVLDRMNAQMDAVKLLESAVQKARQAGTSTEEIKRLSVEYYQATNEFLKMLNGYINQTNRAFVDGKNVEIAEFTDGLLNDLNLKKGVKDFGGQNGLSATSAQGVRNFANALKFEAVSPAQFFRMIGEHGMMLARTFRAGQDAQNRHLDEYVNVMQEETEGEYKTRVASGTGGNRLDVTIDGRKLDVSKSQLMSLYCLWQRPAARNHLEAQGAVFLDASGGEMETRTFPITEEIFNDLMKNLSAQDIRFAQVIQKFLSKECSAWGNEASMKLYGYTMFHEDFYFPIRVSQSTKLKKGGREWGSSAGEMNLEFSSFTNSVQPNSTSAIVIDNIFDVAESHVQKMAAYNAYAPICHDLQRILANGEVREAIVNNMGREALKYMFDFLKKVNGNVANERGHSHTYGVFQTLGNLSKRASVSANFSSAFKQFDSIFRACDEINPKYLIAARTGFGRQNGKGTYGRTYRRMVENSGVAKMKMLGYSDAGFGKSLREQWDKDFAKTPTGLRRFMDASVPTHAVLKGYDKLTDLGMWMSGKADETVWVGLYRACELEAADKYKGASTAEITQRATARFNEIIGETQVVDSVMDSTPFSENVLGTGFGAFMNEPVRQFGHLMVAADAMRDGKPDAKKKFAKVFSTVLFSSMVVEPLKTALASLLRDNEDDDEQFFRKIFKLWTGIDFTDSAQEIATPTGVMSSNLVDGLLGIIPAFGQIYDIVMETVQGYSSTRLETEGIEKLTQYVKALIGYDSKEGIPTKTKAKLTIDILGAVGKITGMPISTLIRDLQIPYKAFMSWTDDYVAQWEYNKMFYNLGNETARSSYGFYDIFSKAVADGDTDSVGYMRNDLEGTKTGKNKFGVTYSEIRDALKDRDGKYIINDDVFLKEIQAEFSLPVVVSDMTPEKLIRQVYAKAVDQKDIAPSDALKALPSTPGHYSYEKKDKNGNTVYEGTGEDRKPVVVEMTETEYAKFIEDVGVLRRNIVSKMATSSEFRKLSDDTEAQIYCLEKAYDFAARYYRSKFNTDYDLSAGGKWMAEFADGKLDYSKIVHEILTAEKGRKK